MWFIGTHGVQRRFPHSVTSYQNIIRRNAKYAPSSNNNNK